MTEGNGISLFGITISAWVHGPLFFVLWMIFCSFAKGFLFHVFRRWGEKTAGRWDLTLTDSLNLPLNILILTGGLALLERLLPLPENLDQPVVIAVKILVVLALALFFDRLIVHLIRQFAGKIQAFDLSRGIVQGVIRLTILSFAVLILLDSVGISITPLIASLGIGSIAVALGLQDTLANLFAGLYLIGDQPVRPGDFVKLESGEEGYVTDIGWRATRICMLPNIVVIVPNQKIISSTIRNYHRPDKELACLVEVGVHYASDLGKVEKVTIEVAREIQTTLPGAVPTFEPFIRYHTFGDSSINFTAILRVKEFREQYAVKHEFIKALHRRYQKEGIVIPFPIRTLEIPPAAAGELVSRLQAGR
jgi:small-conductance mechanosensitive channel